MKLSPFIKNIFVYAFSDGVSKALPFLVFPVVAYYLTAEDYGRVTNFQVFIAILAPFIGLSTNTYLTVEYHRKRESAGAIYNQVVYFIIFLFVVVSIIVFLFSNKIAGWSGLTATWIYIALACSLFTPFTDLFLTMLRMQEKAKAFGLFNFLMALAGSVITIFFIVQLRLGWQGRVWSLVAVALLSGTISIFFGIRFIEKFNKVDFSYWKQFLLFGLPLLPHNLSLWIKSGFEKFVITDSIGLGANGVYSFALSINAIFTIFSTAFFSAFSPYVYRKLSVNDPVDLADAKKDIVKKGYYFLCSYAIILIVGYFILAFLIQHFFLQKYGGATGYLPYLLSYNFFNTVYICLSMFIYYAKATKFLGILTITTSIVQVLLLLVFIPHFGALGSAMAALIVSVITVLLVYFYSNKVYPMPWFKFKN